MAKKPSKKKRKKVILKNDPDAPELKDGIDYKVGNGHPPIDQGFQVGQSPSPNNHGRPPGRCLTNALRQALAKCNEEGIPFAEVMMEMAKDKAVEGDFKFFKEIYDRIEGKVPDTIHSKMNSEHVIIRKSETTPVKEKEDDNDDN